MIERQFMPFLPEYTSYIMYSVFVIAVLIHLYGIKILADQIGYEARGFFSAVFSEIKKISGKQLKSFVSYILFQKKSNKETAGKYYHTPFFYGFIVLTVGTALVGIEEDILKKLFDISFLKGSFYLIFELVLETAGIIVLAGTALLLWRRAVTKPSYLHSGNLDYALLLLLMLIVLTGFLLESMRIGLDPKNAVAVSYVGSFLWSFLLSGADSNILSAWYRGFWFFHMALSMTFIAILPYTKFKHILLIPLNFIINPPKTYGEKAKLNTPFNILEIEEDSEDGSEMLSKVGVGSPGDLEWKERLQIFSCTNCGRCENSCPAHNAGRLLSPRNVIQKVGDEMVEGKNSDVLFENIVLHEEMWGCTHCHACVEVCPSFIRHVDHFLNFRRFIVNSEFEDETKISILGNLDRNGNPYGLPSYARTEWLENYQVSTVAEKNEFEYLYFIGCSSSYDQRCQNITKAIISILNHVGIDFAILGEDERCCGEPAKRMGEEGLFQMTAIQNIELFETYGAKKILVHCPHCYNMLKHEYKDFYGNYEVIHHSELLSDLIESEKIKIDGMEAFESLAFHDPCNLGRLNGIFEPPRNTLKKIGKLVEMERNKELSFCCGGGGGNSFYKVNNEVKRISQIRFEEVLKIRPKVLAVACPFCLTMFEDVRGELTQNGDIPNVLEIAELVSIGLGLGTTTPIEK